MRVVEAFVEQLDLQSTEVTGRRRPAPHESGHGSRDSKRRVEAAGVIVMRCALAVIFLWFGAMKFTSYEATGIAPFIANSPIVEWWHALLGIQGASYMLGIVEIATAILLALHYVWPRASVAGGVMAIVTFLITLSFFAITPGVAAPMGFPAISYVGGFLLKDAGLVGIAIWLLGQSLRESARSTFDLQSGNRTNSQQVN